MVIQINNLVKSYRNKIVLDRIDLSIQKPGVYLIAGPNGSGKTTLLEILVGLRSSNSGQISINGLKPDQVQVKKEVGFLTQQNTLRKNCTVKEELTLVKEIFQLDIDLYEYLTKFNLQEYYNEKTKKLSGGTKRRVLIAMLLMPKYKMIVLDEPVSGLDTYTRDEIWNMIRDYAANNIVIVSDHYLNQASQYSDYIYLINRGKIVLHGKTNELIRNFKYRYIIKTRKQYVENLKRVVKPECEEMDLKVSGSVYNLFMNSENNNSFEEIISSNKYSFHPVNLEDIYFYHTGDLVKEGESVI